MLNELQEAGNALTHAGIAITMRHPEIKPVSARPTLCVHLDANGVVQRVRVLGFDQASKLWTLRDGQHNSFPYHQIKYPLLRVDQEDKRLEVIRNRRLSEAERWSALLALADGAEVNEEAFAGWPGNGFLQRIGERRVQLSTLYDNEASSVPAAFERFEKAAMQPYVLLRGIAAAIIIYAQRGQISSGEFQLAASLLVGDGGALFFDVLRRDFQRLTGDERNIAEISRALNTGKKQEPNGVCIITGQKSFLIADKFPQPNLPILGQTFLFARNKGSPTNARYGHSGMDSVAVGVDAATKLQGVVETLTQPDWQNRTWRGVPGERPKQTDLLIAFVPGAEDIRLAEMLAEDCEPKSGAEEYFASLAERLIDAFDGIVRSRKITPISMLIIRTLDPANRKIVYSNTFTVNKLLVAAGRWSKGCDNTPDTIRIPVLGERGAAARLLAPWDIAPLNLPRITRQHFIRGGTQQHEAVGLTADEAMRLFLASAGYAMPLARTTLRHVLHSRGGLLEGVAHGQSRSFDDLKSFDRREALNTVTLLGLLLYKLGRTREEYMKAAAYKLGQLLAGADLLHAAYNASERGGASLPPRLIGNAALPLAQSNPNRALTVLGRRWAVYHGWATRHGSQWSFPERFRGKRWSDIEVKDRAEYNRAATISRGLSISGRISSVAAELNEGLSAAVVNDEFRAELLLGYIAGLPRATPASDSGDYGADEGDDTPKQGD